MPELPEVEIVCRNLSEIMPVGERIESWRYFRKDLRYPFPKSKMQRLIGAGLRAIRRRAKYILFDFGEYTLISHLGMTGAWRREQKGWIRQKHDHLCFETVNSGVFVFQDPRRFGFIEVIRSKDLAERFSGLGLEPLAGDADFANLTQSFLRLNSPIKSAIMNQKLLVGVGNIYASEILYRVGLNPLKKCSDIEPAQYRQVWRECVKTLTKAIQRGGSTIENYRNAKGEAGSFQSEFFVYGREGEACRKCHTEIVSQVLSGRSTFWCPSCQKK